MNNGILVFRGIDIDKHKFHYYDNPILIYDLVSHTILISKKIYTGGKGYKYLIGYKYDHYAVKPE